MSDEAAWETINRLGLNIPKLNDLRAKAIEPFLDESLEFQEMQQFVEGYLQKDTMGDLVSFGQRFAICLGSITDS